MNLVTSVTRLFFLVAALFDLSTSYPLRPPAAVYSSSSLEQLRSLNTAGVIVGALGRMKEEEEEEETLLSAVLLTNRNTAPAKASLVSWLSGFPYAACLPVQPLSCAYCPDGVDIVFRRKKTEDKSGKDGGIQIRVREDAANGRLLLTARRDSEGQFLRTQIAENKLLQDLREALAHESVADEMNLRLLSASPNKGSSA